mmetsp:Transcript_126686/g.178749  ORF Transcript_126686/g.178749 Transcript_126686/m.178749 type:complete len:114 (+) Transcript_126686:19-360(+)
MESDRDDGSRDEKEQLEESDPAKEEAVEKASDEAELLDKPDDPIIAEKIVKSPERAAKAGASQQKRRILRENLEESRQYMMSYDKDEKRLVVNDKSNTYEHNIWGKDGPPKRS